MGSGIDKEASLGFGCGGIYWLCCGHSKSPFENEKSNAPRLNHSFRPQKE
jgi:hypothetical protein